MNIDVSNAKNVSTREFHYATAKVGGDTIENVEYIVFDHSDWLKPKKAKTFKDKAEAVWDVITTPYYKVKWKIKNACWEVRYGLERMFMGYDSVDAFEIFYKFIKRYSKIIKKLRDNHYGHPCNLTEEEWYNILDEMIYHLYYMDEEHVTAELEKDVPDNWSANAKTVSEVMDKHKDEFFKLFSEYFYNLWD